MPDAMFKSKVNKFDTFELADKVEVAINDGEDIIKLEYYDGRILQFKEQTLYIVNISQAIEFLEDRFKNAGIKYQSCSVETENGIYWINENGLFLYNNDGLQNLLYRDGRRLLSESFWSEFTSEQNSIGYDPKSKKLIIMKDVANTDDNDILVYNLTTGAFFEGTSKAQNEKITNFVLASDNELVYGYTKYVAGPDDYYILFESWDDSPASRRLQTGG